MNHETRLTDLAFALVLLAAFAIFLVAMQYLPYLVNMWGMA
jgi:hypothetical protein